MPKHNRRADTTGDLAKFIACLQEIIDLLCLGEFDVAKSVFILLSVNLIRRRLR